MAKKATTTKRKSPKKRVTTVRETVTSTDGLGNVTSAVFPAPVEVEAKYDKVEVPALDDVVLKEFDWDAPSKSTYQNDESIYEDTTKTQRKIKWFLFAVALVALLVAARLYL